jgi:hypothetical protein
MQTKNYATIAAFSVLWIVLAYLSKSLSINSIVFDLPILLIFTVPIWFGMQREGLVIGLIGAVLGKNFLVSGGAQGAIVDLVFTLGLMMGATYVAFPPSIAEMRKSEHWLRYIVTSEVLLTIGVAGTLVANALFAGSSPNYSTIGTQVEGTVIGGLLLLIINAVLLRTLTPSFKRDGIYAGKTEEKRELAAIAPRTN